jgi:feruloyl esterase
MVVNTMGVVGAAVVLLSGALAAPPAAAGMSCTTLVALSQPGSVVITSAVAFPGGSFTGPDGSVYQNVPAFCEVSALLTPTTDSAINVYVWLPSTGWSGRFEGTGNGGYAGTVALSVPAMISGLEAGSAVAGTDMGTAPSANNDADALVGHPEKWIDFGYRATHLMTVIGKELVEAYYGQAPTHSYFNGCSTGGQQALMEAQSYPTDYDGILGGDPAANRTRVHTAILWNYYNTHLPAANSLIGTDQTQAITAAVVSACVVKSGGLITDPFLTDPRKCDWDPGALACTGAPNGNCLTPGEVAAARAIYAGATDPATGHLIFPGSVRGGESDTQFGWVGIQDQPEVPFGSLFKWVFGIDWLWPTFDFNQNMADLDQVLAPILNANNPDLSAFAGNGGKLLMYQGWADPLVAPQMLIDYYLMVEGKFGSGPGALAQTQNFFRLFMVPGMYHCAFGPGPNAFGNLFSGQVYAAPPPVADAQHDAMLALEKWVEKGVAPTSLIATKYDNDVPELGITMQRPICPFLHVPQYKGSGATNVASSFSCVTDTWSTNPTPAPEYLD